MGNPAPFPPFQARSRLRLRRSGAISLSTSACPPLAQAQSLSLHHVNNSLSSHDNHSHVHCPCCTSTLTLAEVNTARYAPYALSARRAFQRRRHHPVPPAAQPAQFAPYTQGIGSLRFDLPPANNLGLGLGLDLDDDHDDSRSDSHSHSQSHADADADQDPDLDAIPFPYASPTTAAATSTSTSTSTSASASASAPSSASPPPPAFSFSFSFNSTPPPIPRLPSSSDIDIQRLDATLPNPTTIPDATFTLSANAAAQDRTMHRLRSMRSSGALLRSLLNSSDNLSELADPDPDPDPDPEPEPWMYGTLPRRASVTVPYLRDQGTQMISPSSGVTAATPSAAAAASAVSTRASPSSSSAAGEQQQQQGGRPGTLVSNVFHGVYSSLSAFLGSSSTNTPTMTTANPPPSSSTTATSANPASHILPRDPDTAPSRFTFTASPLADTPAPGAELASTSVSSTRPRTPHHAGTRRPTGLALAPALSARSRGTLAAAAVAAAQASADHDQRTRPWSVPGESTVRVNVHGHDRALSATPHQAGYLHALNAYAAEYGATSASTSTTSMAGGGGGRGGRLVFPPTPRAFYATVGSASAPGAENDTRALPDPSAWGGDAAAARDHDHDSDNEHAGAFDPMSTAHVRARLQVAAARLSEARAAHVPPSPPVWLMPYDAHAPPAAASRRGGTGGAAGGQEEGAGAGGETQYEYWFGSPRWMPMDEVPAASPHGGGGAAAGEDRDGDAEPPTQYQFRSPRWTMMDDARTALLHGGGAATREEQVGEREEMVEDDQDDEDDTYIPAYLLSGGSSTGDGSSSRSAVAGTTGPQFEQGGEMDDDDLFGLMDDSWEMVVRPFDSARGPTTPYDYHDHMF